MQTNNLASNPANGAEQIAVSARTAAVMFDVSLATWRRWDSAGRVPKPARVGGTVRWLRDDLERWSKSGMPSRGDFEAMESQ